VGLHAALDYLDEVGLERVQAYERHLFRYTRDRLRALHGVDLYGPGTPERQAAIFSFNVQSAAGEPIHPSDVGMLLNHAGVAVRVGHHCAQPLLTRLGLAGTCRASLYLYNTERDIDRLVEGVAQARRFFGRR
jgi:cysteine desulfurase/selenocysteine lyase